MLRQFWAVFSHCEVPCRAFESAVCCVWSAVEQQLQHTAVLLGKEDCMPRSLSRLSPRRQEAFEHV